MKIAIVGASGEVGRMMITCLEEAGIQPETLDLYASSRSAGKTMYFRESAIPVQQLNDKSLCQKYDYVLFSAGGAIARHYAPIAADAGSVVIDNSSAWRRHENIPLVVPEINGVELEDYYGIIANPNCSTIQMVLALNPLHKEYALRKVVVSTYQSVSGSGHTGVKALQQQRQGSTEIAPYPELIDLNVIPQIGSFLDDGYCQEEDKMHYESQRILHIPGLAVSATTVRVPVLYGHSESVYAEFDKEIELRQAGALLKQSESVVYHDNGYITPRQLGNSDDSHVARLRYGTDKRSLAFWCVGHNVRLGAATNAVRILQKHYALNHK